MPAGGAEMDFVVVPLPGTSLTDFIASELQGTMSLSTSTTTVSGSHCTQESFTDSYGPTIIYGNIAIYCPQGKHLYKLYLSYREGDPMESQFVHSFQQVLSSITLP